MPYIQIEAVKPAKEQKEKLISELTRAASEILGVDKEFFCCIVKENETDNWGIGGKTLTRFFAEKQGNR